MIKKLLIPALLILLAFLTYSCEGIFGEDDEFTMDRRPYYGDQLRLDGYYYFYYDYDEDRQTIHVEILFNNGVIVNGYSMGLVDVNRREQEYRDGTFYNSVKNTVYFWGIFRIFGDSIAYERRYPADSGVLHGYIDSGKILNDTTFHLTRSMRSNGTEVREINELYHFKKFDGKPDSSNRFVK
ncbi:MAG: hypothetical protein KAH48_09040 [Chlorobi bacterium]|nr:hypothetical protein [Chlorobiota bacterium]